MQNVSVFDNSIAQLKPPQNRTPNMTPATINVPSAKRLLGCAMTPQMRAMSPLSVLGVSVGSLKQSLPQHEPRLGAAERHAPGNDAVQLFLAPSRIHARMAFLSQIDSFFLPCGMRSVGEARQSSSHTRLLLSGSRGTTIAPNLVPFIRPS